MKLKTLQSKGNLKSGSLLYRIKRRLFPDYYAKKDAEVIKEGAKRLDCIIRDSRYPHKTPLGIRGRR